MECLSERSHSKYPRRPWRSPPTAILGTGMTGCAASVHFYSKTGQEFPELTHHAVIIENNEVDAIRSAGGFPIGTESGEGLNINSTQEDVSDKAAVVAGRKGGTHI